MLIEDADGTELRGSPGAVREFSGSLRVSVPEMSANAVGDVAGDGSFSVSVDGAMRDQLHYVELIERTDDVFVGAVVGDEGTSVVLGDPGPDGDRDGSPDAIDCAPSDETLRGQRCTFDGCNGLDDDGDGFVDEDCGTCRSAADCSPAEACVDGLCSATCVNDADCGAGQRCVAGSCTL